MRALHRRQTIHSILESGGFALASGCIILLPILAHEIWKNQSRASLLLLVLIACTLVGIIWGWSRRLSLLAVAVEADRQLGLNDLISTSLNCDDYDRAFAVSLIEEAERRATMVRPSQVRLARFGVRSWSGIGLLFALVLSLSSIAQTNAHDRDIALKDAGHSAKRSLSPTRDRPLLDLSPDNGRRAMVRPDPEDLDASKFGQNSDPKVDSATTRRSAARGDHPQANQSSSSGAGSGMSRSDDTQAASIPGPDIGSKASSSPTNTVGEAASGTGNAAQPGSPSNAASGGVVANHDKNDAAYWHSNAWQSQVDSAHQRLENGQIPPSYRDLVREYFR